MATQLADDKGLSNFIRSASNQASVLNHREIRRGPVLGAFVGIVLGSLSWLQLPSLMWRLVPLFCSMTSPLWQPALPLQLWKVPLSWPAVARAPLGTAVSHPTLANLRHPGYSMTAHRQNFLAQVKAMNLESFIFVLQVLYHSHLAARGHRGTNIVQDKPSGMPYQSTCHIEASSCTL